MSLESALRLPQGKQPHSRVLWRWLAFLIFNSKYLKRDFQLQMPFHMLKEKMDSAKTPSWMTPSRHSAAQVLPWRKQRSPVFIRIYSLSSGADFWQVSETGWSRNKWWISVSSPFSLVHALKSQATFWLSGKIPWSIHPIGWMSGG